MLISSHKIPGKSHKSLGKLKKESHEPEFHGGTRPSFATCGAWEIQIRAVTWVQYRATTQVCRVYILDERFMKTFQQIGQLEMGCLAKRGFLYSCFFQRNRVSVYTWMSSLLFWWMYIASILKPSPWSVRRDATPGSRSYFGAWRKRGSNIH